MILALLRLSHKSPRQLSILVFLVALGLSTPAVGQEPSVHAALSLRDVASIGVASVLYVTPRVFHIGPGPSDCAPCDRSGLPAFDRWAIAEPRRGWGRASTVLLVGLAGVAGAELASTPAGARHAVAIVETGAWAVGLAEMFKGIIGRRRPVLYTVEAPAAVSGRNSRRSLPSGHTAAAFAVATSYWLSRRTLHGSPGVPGWVAVAAAAGVGVMRVTAGKHFPSDVLAGAALGAGTAVVVHVLKF